MGRRPPSCPEGEAGKKGALPLPLNSQPSLSEEHRTALSMVEQYYTGVNEHTRMIRANTDVVIT